MLTVPRFAREYGSYLQKLVDQCDGDVNDKMECKQMIVKKIRAYSQGFFTLENLMAELSGIHYSLIEKIHDQ